MTDTLRQMLPPEVVAAIQDAENTNLYEEENIYAS